VALGKQLGLSVIAKGVEDAENRRYVRRLRMNRKGTTSASCGFRPDASKSFVRGDNRVSLGAILPAENVKGSGYECEQA
jgi:hypothetical protein